MSLQQVMMMIIGWLVYLYCVVKDFISGHFYSNPQDDQSVKTDNHDGFVTGQIKDNWDEESIGDNETREVDVSAIKTNDTLEDRMDELQKQEIRTVYRKNEITLIFDKRNTLIETQQVVTVEQCDQLQIVCKDNMFAAVATIILSGFKYSVVCNHILYMLDESNTEGMKEVNPQICARVPHIANKSLIWKVSHHDTVNWYTYDIKTNKYLFVSTNVTQPIRGYVTMNGRPRMTIIAIIVSIKPEYEYVYSGTLMVVNETKPFIVVYRTTTCNRQISHIVACAPFYHINTIKTQYGQSE